MNNEGRVNDDVQAQGTLTITLPVFALVLQAFQNSATPKMEIN